MDACLSQYSQNGGGATVGLPCYSRSILRPPAPTSPSRAGSRSGGPARPTRTRPGSAGDARWRRLRTYRGSAQAIAWAGARTAFFPFCARVNAGMAHLQTPVCKRCARRRPHTRPGRARPSRQGGPMPDRQNSTWYRTTTPSCGRPRCRHP